ncbi:MAG: GDP-L-fucose synthase [Nitrospirae bacterium]|nr:GDP-L-fucose synthase [Nitrospirota bacterium]
MKIYVAGHRGLVGSAILRKLNERDGTEIVCRTSKELDLRNQADTETFFEEEKPEQMYLSAAKVGGILANNTYKAEFIYDNTAIALNVINAAYKNGVSKLLNLGSSCIYPKLAPQPLKEEHLLIGPLESTNEPYAIAKITAIKLCRYYNEQYGTNYLSVMPTNLYGPQDNFNLETSHVLPALIRKFHLAKLLRNGDIEGLMNDMKTYPLGFGIGKPHPHPDPLPEGEGAKFIPSPILNGGGLEPAPEVVIGGWGWGLFSVEFIEDILKHLGITKDSVVLWGSGEPYREFLYVDDLADACVYLMENYDYKDTGELVNIGMGEDIKIKELAGIIRDVVGFDGRIEHDLSKPDGTPRKLLDISKIKSLGWEPKISLKDGINKTYEWYLKH